MKKIIFIAVILLFVADMPARNIHAWYPADYPEEISKILKYRFDGRDRFLGLDRRSLYSNKSLRDFYKGRNYQPLWITGRDYYKKRLRWIRWIWSNMKFDGYHVKPYHRMHTEITLRDYNPLITFSDLADLEVYLTADMHYLVTHYPSIFWAGQIRRFLADAKVSEDYLKTALPLGLVYPEPIP